MDREKEIKRDMYLHSQIIKEEKKILKTLRKELEELYNQKKLVRGKKHGSIQ